MEGMNSAQKEEPCMERNRTNVFTEEPLLELEALSRGKSTKKTIIREKTFERPLKRYSGPGRELL